jgi:hypothetical protein
MVCHLRGAVGPFFFEGTGTGAMYFNMLQESILPTIHQLYGDEDMWYQQDGAPHITIVMSGLIMTTLFPTTGQDTEDLLNTPHDHQI